LGLGLEAPIGARVAHAIEIADGHVDPEIVVLAARLEQQDGDVRIGGEAVGQQAARRAAADDDVVEGAERGLGHDRTRHRTKTRSALAGLGGGSYSPRARSTCAASSEIERPCALAISFSARQNAASSVTLVRCPAMTTECFSRRWSNDEVTGSRSLVIPALRRD